MVRPCADAVALYHGRLVLIERLNEPKGLALPGGKREKENEIYEPVETCAVREYKEETGLELRVLGYLGHYDDPSRDPRGPMPTDVVYGTASGTIRNEPGKTRVMLVHPKHIHLYEKKFLFDHYQIVQNYLRGPFMTFKQEVKNIYTGRDAQ